MPGRGDYNPAKDRANQFRRVAGRYQLRCPAACGGPVAEGQAEAARLVREHPAVCPNPGPVIPGSTVHPLTYADRIK